MAYDPATYKVNLDTPQPDGRKGESPRNAFTKYNALVDKLKDVPPAPTTTTTNNIPQWSNTTGTLKNGLGLSTSTTLAGNSNANVPTERAVKAYADALPKPQDYGIGRVDNGVRLSTSELENPLPNGVYVIDSTNESIEKPSNFGVMWAGSYSGANDRKCQIWMEPITSKLFIRSTQLSLEWAEVLTTLNTNLIVSSGSNANGDWIKFADGTQMCTQSTGSETTSNGPSGGQYYSDLLGLTFPSSFISNPICFMSVTYGGGFPYPGLLSSVSTTGASARIYALVNSAFGRAHVLTIGRWK